MSAIFNPLNAQTPNLESTSKVMKNDTHGVCPKCQGHMSICDLKVGEEVYYCVKCRVSSPLPVGA